MQNELNSIADVIQKSMEQEFLIPDEKSAWRNPDMDISKKGGFGR